MKLPKKLRQALSKIGREAAKRQSANMTPEQKRDRAKKAVAAREKKRKERGSDNA